jgi:hypothetical protein
MCNVHWQVDGAIPDFRNSSTWENMLCQIFIRGEGIVKLFTVLTTSGHLQTQAIGCKKWPILT